MKAPSQRGHEILDQPVVSLETENAVAQKVQVLLVDDVTGGDAAETVSFALDGVSYEIDLSEENATELREALTEWIDHARRVGGRRRGGRSRALMTAGDSSTLDTQVIRAWARNAGHEVSDRGRISASIIEAYREAHGI